MAPPISSKNTLCGPALIAWLVEQVKANGELLVVEGADSPARKAAILALAKRVGKAEIQTHFDAFPQQIESYALPFLFNALPEGFWLFESERGLCINNVALLDVPPEAYQSSMTPTLPPATHNPYYGRRNFASCFKREFVYKPALQYTQDEFLKYIFIYPSENVASQAKGSLHDKRSGIYYSLMGIDLSAEQKAALENDPQKARDFILSYYVRHVLCRKK